ncbi:hypothetical protein AADZ90_011615 [Aestuariibius sp. 2305UL40-4]|uniref:hypothetical protein n=1 Tax=Aestuariibius violaceus TaxID=3234132 RepID=UPI00345E393B
MFTMVRFKIWNGAAAFIAAAVAFAAPATAQPRIDLSAVPHQVGAFEPLSSNIIASFEEGNFLESVIVLSSGDLLITEIQSRTIWRVDPSGARAPFHQSDIQPVGLAVDIDGQIVLSGSTADGNAAIFTFKDDGALDRTILIEGAQFLNGVAFVAPGQLLVADSGGGLIIHVDIESEESRIWSSDESLGVHPDRSPLLPGVNGLKVFDGAVYATNSSRTTLLRIPAIGLDYRAGSPEVILQDISFDDLAIAADGTIYGTTHIFDSVVRIEQDGSVTTVAKTEQGVAGSTAAAFGRRAEDRNTLYVVGDGGFYLDPENPAPANVVAIGTDEPGLSLEASFSHIDYPNMEPAARMTMVRCMTVPGSDERRRAVAPDYDRFLKLNIARIAFAGEVYGDGREAELTARLYFMHGLDEARAEGIMESSPYLIEGVYSSCDAVPFDAMPGSIAWPDELSRGR